MQCSQMGERGSRCILQRKHPPITVDLVQREKQCTIAESVRDNNGHRLEHTLAQLLESCSGSRRCESNAGRMSKYSKNSPVRSIRKKEPPAPNRGHWSPCSRRGVDWVKHVTHCVGFGGWLALTNFGTIKPVVGHEQEYRRLMEPVSSWLYVALG